MKLINWIVALCNRKWQREFNTMVKIVGSDDDLIVEEDVTDILDSQPTHLSHKFRTRAKRKHSNKVSQAQASKEETLAKIMEEEFAHLAK
jgi:hypothetical protein